MGWGPNSVLKYTQACPKRQSACRQQMLPLLRDGGATTTEAVRRATQNNQVSLREPAARHGIPKTVAKWRRADIRCGSGDRGAAGLRPDQAITRPGASVLEQHPREKTWRMSVVLHKMSDSPGVEKEAVE
jgi:hypothetical protein